MDKKKLTRRAALTSAVGSLAAAPLVLQALKGKYSATLPENPGEHLTEEEAAISANFRESVQPIVITEPEGYAAEWHQNVKMLDVPIADIGGRSACQLECRPGPDMDLHVVYLVAKYQRSSEFQEYPQPPFYHMITKGHAQTTSPVVKGKPAILINAEAQVTRSPHHVQEVPGGTCIAVPGNGHFVFYREGHGTPDERLLSGRNVNLPCAAIAGKLSFDYPKKVSLSQGTQWTVPKAGEKDGDTQCRISGFSRVAGREAVTIVAQKKLAPRMASNAVASAAKVKPRPDKLRDAVIVDSITETVDIVAHIDLETGLALRQEWKVTAHQGNSSEASQSTVFISQVLQS